MVDVASDAVDGHVVHYSCTQPNRFQKHTEQSLNALADYLKEAKNRGMPHFDDVCSTLGFHYDPRNWPYDEYVRRIAPLPWCMFPDQMHSLTASGGILQYSLNKVCFEITTALRIPMERLDAFASCVKFPKRMRLERNFFATRTVHPTRKKLDVHMKGFASEMLQASDVLVLFSRVVLTPHHMCPEVSKYMESVFKMMTIIRRGDAVADAAALECPVVEHANEFARLCPEGIKPKFHVPFHLADDWRMHQKKADCFVGERQHKIPKSLSPNKEFATACLRFGLRELLDSWANPDTFQPNSLNDTAKPLAAAQEIYRSLGDALHAWQGISVKTSHAGQLFRKDLLVWGAPEGRQVGTAKRFIRIYWANGTETVFAAVHRHAYKGDGWWEYAAESREVLVHLQLVHSIAFVRDEDNGLFLLL